MARSWTILLGVEICLTLSVPVLAGTYSGGSGTAEDPFRISSVADWQELIASSADWDKNFSLLNDIDFGGIDLTPVAPDASLDYGYQGPSFTGVFEGNHHVVGNATINLPSRDYVGLFGYLESPGQIRNLQVDNILVTAHNYAGGLVGINKSGTIFSCSAASSVGGFASGGLVGWNYGTMTSCRAAGNVTGTMAGGLAGHNISPGTITSSSATGFVSGAQVGGLVSQNSGTIVSCRASGNVTGTLDRTGGLASVNSGTIFSSSASGTVKGRNQVGGLVGSNIHDGSITGCSASGLVEGTQADVGGLTGENDGTIAACYATGSVNGKSAGGLVGHNELNGIVTSCYATGPVDFNVSGGLVGYNYGTIVSCYAIGSITGQSGGGGGLVGTSYSGSITSSFWDVQTSGLTDGVGKPDPDPAGLTGKTTAEMKTLSTFIDAGWDFVGESANGTADIWRMCADGVNYPRLAWEFSQIGDFDCPNGVAMEDLLYLAERWTATTPETIGASDANADDKANLPDFAILAARWLQE